MLKIKKNLKSLFSRNLTPNTYNLKPSKGFTLIELLVVIAIIGILSSVVLTSLTSARKKANDAKVVSQLSSMRAAAELYSGSGTAVALATCPVAGTNLFFDIAGTNSLASLFGGLTISTTNSACFAAAGLPTNGAAWAAAIKLPSLATGYFCVDSSGVARDKTAGGVAYTAANGASPAAITTNSCN